LLISDYKFPQSAIRNPQSAIGKMLGSKIHRYETVTSTNDIARELAAGGAVEGTVVVAAEQTKGRGSRGRVWLSPPGVNLLVSVILRPRIPRARFSELAFVTAVAIAGTLRECCGLEARIKWPNDIRVGGRKICGVIVEAVKDAVILGIGVNVNWTELPEEIKETATSVAIERDELVDIEHVLKALLADLDITYGVYRARGFGRILEQWKALEITTRNESLIVELANGEVQTIPAATVVS
jgi:BirA family biotin operon repressor/biotin-[acetyl-CoA-carboxylase] ligase